MKNKQKIYVIWHDYDGPYTKEFSSQNKECNKLISQILIKQSAREYGTYLVKVIKGIDLEYV